MSGDVIVTVTLNAALHVAYEVLASGGTTPPRPPRSSFRGDPSPRTPLGKGYPPPHTPPAPLAPPRSPVLSTGRAAAA